jgi:hypothetical protein
MNPEVRLELEVVEDIIWLCLRNEKIIILKKIFFILSLKLIFINIYL